MAEEREIEGRAWAILILIIFSCLYRTRVRVPGTRVRLRRVTEQWNEKSLTSETKLREVENDDVWRKIGRNKSISFFLGSFLFCLSNR